MRPLCFPGCALALCLGAFPLTASAQKAADDASSAAPASDFRKVALSRKADLPETLEPTWETRPNASTTYFQIPAPRGQITDRNGLPLAQSKLAYHLDLNFPPGEEMSDTQLVSYVRNELVAAQGILKRPIEVKTSDIVDHYRNRRMLPMDIATYLSTEEVAAVRSKLTADSGLSLRPVYQRFYPNGSLAAHIVGYCGKIGGTPQGPLQPNETLWSDIEGREGLEKSFNEQLTGHPGSLNMTFDGKGDKTSERIVSPPVPGSNVITTLDLNLQRLCEQILAKEGKRGAMVVVEPNSGDILAMASYPTFDPNEFVPFSAEYFNKINEDPNIPLIPRAFRATYPPGSTFKIIVGAAALQSHTIDKNDEFTGPAAMTIGNVLMHNWKKTDAGDLTFTQALAQSCDTWFYQVGIKTGPATITDWAKRFGLGAKTGLPLRDEMAGVIPDNDYMKRVHKRKFYDGDAANMAIGQGDLEVTPVQMAQAMATLANGGQLHQIRLVEQVQTLDNGVSSAYQVRVRRDVGLSGDIFETIKKGMGMVVDSGMGTAHQAHVDGVDVGGKTGTAQWGAGNNNKEKSRTAAWFTGFAPLDKPQFAYAAVLEGDPGVKMHGSETAGLVGKMLRQIYKTDKPEKAERHKKHHSDDDDDDAPPKDQAPDDTD